MSLRNLIKRIQDIMRKDVGVDGDAQRISQMVWIIFLKIFDAKEDEWEFANSNYKTPLNDRLRWRNWAKDSEGMTGEDLLNFVNQDLFPSLKTLAEKEGVSAQGRVVGNMFSDAYNYMKSGTLLRQVINVIESDLNFHSSEDRHIFNDIYEQILADLQSAGNAGEYYTPRAVTQFIVDMVDPKIGESILDPACGTGGFLTCAINHLDPKSTKDYGNLQKNIHGVEKKPLPHMLAVTNMMLHGIDTPVNIRLDNTLARPYISYTDKDRKDIIITNPPFGGVEEDGIESNMPKKFQTRETADLFMALIMNLLKRDTGRAAVVLPDGFLFGEGVKTTIKEELLCDFNLHTIVRLPNGVFSPYTSIATNILFFERSAKGTKEIWFFEHPYPEGYKSYSRTRPLTIEEFDREKAWWNDRENSDFVEYAWKVSIDEIKAKNYNFDFKNPYVYEEHLETPEALFAELTAINEAINKTQAMLKAELMKAMEK